MTTPTAPPAPPGDNGHADSEFARPPEDLLRQLQADVARAGGELPDDADRIGAIGATMFDLPGSEDQSVTVLLPQDHVRKLPSQSLVRIKSGDRRTYLGVVTAGPFAEPDTLRADSHLLVTVTARGGVYLPPYHGRVQVDILGEELDGALVPPRLRPLPNSPVHALSEAESAQVLRTGGDLRLGLAVGHENVVVQVPSDKKAVLPRHLAVLGTTGAGKSTTVARLVHQLQKAGVATVLLDVEGEYTEMDRPTDDEAMRTALGKRGLQPEGVARFAVGHLVGRETTRPAELGQVRRFSLRFADLSPFAIKEILDLSDAQEERFLKTYDTLKLLLKDTGVFPRSGEEQLALEVDDLETGTPRMTLLQMIDVAGVFADMVSAGKEERGGKKAEVEACAASALDLRSPELKGHEAAVRRRAAAAKAPGSLPSWRGLLGKLWRVYRLKLFDNPEAEPLNHAGLIQPGRVCVIDLSDTDSPQVNNLVIADVLRGIWRAQEESFARATREGNRPTPVAVLIEEAHEFLSEKRIGQMQVLFQQVARIAKRGRKRWLSLGFITQLPQHLPHEVLSLCNNFILHKLTDARVLSALRHTISGIDESLWARLPGLAPGQAIVSFGHMARPLLTSIDPALCRLRMAD